MFPRNETAINFYECHFTSVCIAEPKMRLDKLKAQTERLKKMLSVLGSSLGRAQKNSIKTIFSMLGP